MTTPIQYETAVAEFEEGLLNALRGHAAAAEYLELWVPDEDPVKSLLNMAESAETFGQTALVVAVRRSTLPAARDAELAAVLGELGHVRLEAQGDGVLITVTELGGASALEHVHESLRAGVQRQLAAVTHEGPLEERPGLLRVAVSEAPVELAALIDPTDHTVTIARHSGARTPVERAILEALCAAIEGAPAQDAGDHGPLRALASLHDADAARPVAGILHPVNADPAFVAVVRLAHHLRETWRERTDSPRAYNEFDRPPAADWLALDAGGRHARVEAGIAGFLADRGLSDDAIQLLRLDGDLHGQPVRAVVTFADAVAAQDKPDLMRVLERSLKRLVEGTLQLYHEQRKDENTIRRL